MNSLMNRARNAFQGRLHESLVDTCVVVGRGEERLETAFGYEHLETRHQYPCAIVDITAERRALQGDTLRARADVEIFLPCDAQIQAGDRIEANNAIFDVIDINIGLSLQPCVRAFCVRAE